MAINNPIELHLIVWPSFNFLNSVKNLSDRAWDKGSTAEVESSHGRFNPTKSRVKSTLKSTF